jgi:hypothetical protein
MRTYKQLTSWATAHGFQHIKKRKYSDLFVFEENGLHIHFYRLQKQEGSKHPTDQGNCYAVQVKFGNPKNPCFSRGTISQHDKDEHIKAKDVIPTIQKIIEELAPKASRYATRTATEELNRANYFDKIRFGLRRGRKLEDAIQNTDETIAELVNRVKLSNEETPCPTLPKKTVKNSKKTTCTVQD